MLQPKGCVGEGGNVMIRVEDILRRKGTRIITVRLGETVAVAVGLMNRENVHALVVKDVCRTEGNTVVGIFSERDVARGLAAHGAAVLAMPIAKLLNRPLVSCTTRDSIDTVLQLMDEHQVRLLPVLDNYTLIGVISVSDVIHQLTQTPALAAHIDVAPAAGLRS
jgi:CBS domain-containing protein